MARKKRKIKSKTTSQSNRLSVIRNKNDNSTLSAGLSLFNGDLVKIFLVFKLIVIAAILLGFYYFDSFHSTNLWNRWYTEKTILEAWYIPFSNWDGQHYLLLADQGYGSLAATYSKAFFPLLPFCIRLLNFIVGDIYIATMALNFIFSYFFIHFFYGYALHYLPKRQAIKAVMLFLAFPATFYMTVFYNEALFLFALFGFLYFYQIKKSYKSVPFALMMPLIRGQAMFVLMAVGIYMLWSFCKQNRQFRSGYELSNVSGFAAGGVIYGLFFYFTTDSFFTGVDAQNMFAFNNSLANLFNPSHFISYLFSPTEGIFSYTNSVVDKFFVVALLGCTIFVARTQNRLGTLVYFFLLYFSAAMGSGGSFTRFSLLAFPILAIAILRLYPKMKHGFYIGCILLCCLQIYFTCRFALNLWVS